MDESADRFSNDTTDLDDSITGLYVEDKAIGTDNGLEITALENEETSLRIAIEAEILFTAHIMQVRFWGAVIKPVHPCTGLIARGCPKTSVFGQFP